DDVRAVLTDLTSTRYWLPGVVESRMDGDIRICTMADGQEVHERILEVSPDRLRFEHVRIALPVRDSHGTFTVNPTGDGATTVALELSFEPLDPTLTDRLTAGISEAFGESLRSMRIYIEEKSS